MKKRYLILTAVVCSCLRSEAAIHVHGDSATIKFPDEESIQIQARPSPPLRTVDHDSVTLADIRPSLKKESDDGDGSAAWLLSISLSSCNFAYSDERSLNEAIEHLRRTGELIPPGGADPTPLRPGTDVAQAEEDLFRRPFRFCRGITPDQRAESDRWLKRAADLGYPPAALALAQRLGRTNEALRLYEIAWKDGKYDAAGSLGMLYEKGSPGEREPDPVKGLAYTFIYHKITQYRLDGATTPIRSNALERAKSTLDGRMKEASPQVREEAMKLAKRLLRENKNCCYGY